ncbi:MAG: hypothetical protein IJS15_03490 [Victivallales bacterium]|nr:hypothetical protein [Victivallales bacterium]
METPVRCGGKETTRPDIAIAVRHSIPTASLSCAGSAAAGSNYHLGTSIALCGFPVPKCVFYAIL